MLARSVAEGYEPDPTELLRLEPDPKQRLRLLTDLCFGTSPDSASTDNDGPNHDNHNALRARVLVLEDVHMCMEACEQHEADQRAVAALGQVSEQEAAAESRRQRGQRSKPVRGPRTTKEAKRWSRKLFGRLACLKREAKAHGCQLVKIPIARAQCRTCSRWRVVDKRASSALVKRFACGDAIQVDQQLACHQPDEELPPAVPTTAQPFTWVWMERITVSDSGESLREISNQSLASTFDLHLHVRGFKCARVHLSR